MSDAEAVAAGVAPFPCQVFRSRDEYALHAEDGASVRTNRWLFEQSLASSSETLTLQGTCGICLCQTRFTSTTRGGEVTAAGHVPNWREAMVCDCTQPLTNRERSLLHYLLAYGLLQPWMRVLAFGDLGGLYRPLRSMSGELMVHPVLVRPQSRLPVHLVVSSEQLNASNAGPDTFAEVAGFLVPGGHFVFTAPFDPASLAPDDMRISWSVLKTLKSVGFSDAKVSTFWSEEFGYLGLFNFIFSASK